MIEHLLPATAAPRITHYSAPDGYRSYVRIWDVAQPAGRVVCLHGIISHGGWYLQSCQRLAEAGFEVHYLERRGSGLNAEQRGDVDRCQTWIEDVTTYLENLPGDLPRILLGVSWGGKLAVAVTKHSPHLVDALGMLCPGMYAPRGPNAFQKRALAVLARTRLRGKRVTIPLQDPALFTDAVEWQTYIAHDPLVLREITLRFAYADTQLDAYVANAAQGIRTAAMLMLAGKDRITDNVRLRKFFGELASPSKELIEYPDAAHTFEFEPDPEPFFRDLTDWVRSQTSAATSSVRSRHPR